MSERSVLVSETPTFDMALFELVIDVVVWFQALCFVAALKTPVAMLDRSNKLSSVAAMVT